MKCVLVRKCVLVALTLLIPATQGRANPWRKNSQDIRYQTHYGKLESRQVEDVQGRASRSLQRHHKTQVRSSSSMQQLLRETLDELLEEAQTNNDLLNHLESPASPRLPQRLHTNHIHDVGLSDEQEASYYSARHVDRNQRLLSASTSSRQAAHLYKSYQTYHAEVCETKKAWTLMNETVDVNGNRVEIVNPIGKPQYVYSYECVSPCTACRAVNRASMCKMRYTYVKMYHRLLYGYREEDPIWDFVEVPSHCACELVPPNYDDPDCLI